MSQKKQKEIDLESLTPEEKVKYEIAEELGLLGSPRSGRKTAGL